MKTAKRIYWGLIRGASTFGLILLHNRWFGIAGRTNMQCLADGAFLAFWSCAIYMVLLKRHFTAAERKTEV